MLHFKDYLFYLLGLYFITCMYIYEYKYKCTCPWSFWVHQKINSFLWWFGLISCQVLLLDYAIYSHGKKNHDMVIQETELISTIDDDSHSCELTKTSMCFFDKSMLDIIRYGTSDIWVENSTEFAIKNVCVSMYVRPPPPLSESSLRIAAHATRMVERWQLIASFTRCITTINATLVLTSDCFQL